MLSKEEIVTDEVSLGDQGIMGKGYENIIC
jgi:hypothetical protein